VDAFIAQARLNYKVVDAQARRAGIWRRLWR
jgi:hypothetical protein